MSKEIVDALKGMLESIEKDDGAHDWAYAQFDEFVKELEEKIFFARLEIQKQHTPKPQGIHAPEGWVAEFIETAQEVKEAIVEIVEEVKTVVEEVVEEIKADVSPKGKKAAKSVETPKE